MRFPYSRTHTCTCGNMRSEREYTRTCVYHECVIECVGNTSIWPDKLKLSYIKLSHMRIHCICVIVLMHIYIHTHTQSTMFDSFEYIHINERERERDAHTVMRERTYTSMCIIAAGYRNTRRCALATFSNTESERKITSIHWNVYDYDEICYRLDCFSVSFTLPLCCHFYFFI